MTKPDLEDAPNLPLLLVLRPWWVWRSGMRYNASSTWYNGVVLEGDASYCTVYGEGPPMSGGGFRQYAPPSGLNATPDLSDPATQGWLLDMLGDQVRLVQYVREYKNQPRTWVVEGVRTGGHGMNAHDHFRFGDLCLGRALAKALLHVGPAENPDQEVKNA